MPSLLAISEGLTPNSLSLMISAACRRTFGHTPLIAALTLGFGDALPLALQHGFPLDLPYGSPRPCWMTALDPSASFACHERLPESGRSADRGNCDRPHGAA